MISERLLVASVALLPAALGAQASRIPVRDISTPVVSTERIKGLPGVRHLPDGHVLVNDQKGRRLLVFDSTLTRFSISGDSVSTGGVLYPGATSLPPALVPYLGDSTLFVDFPTKVLLLLDPAGKVARAVAHPRARDLTNMSLPYGGNPGTDNKGRLLYRSARANYRPPQPGDPEKSRDTVSIIRANFETREVDTVATYSTPKSVLLASVLSPSGKHTNPIKINPMPFAPDDWAVLSDGTLAIVRAHDYHVDWISPDGVKSSTAKLPFDWRRMTDDDKRARLDSAKKVIDSLDRVGETYGMMISAGDMVNGKLKRDTIFPVLTYARLDEMPDYVPPIREGAAKADADGNLWILPTTSSEAGTGLVYDVVNRKGELFERVRLPANFLVAGFGKGGVVYLAKPAGPYDTWLLGRARVKH